MHEGIHAFRPSNSGGFGTDRLKPGLQTTEFQRVTRAFLAFMHTRWDEAILQVLRLLPPDRVW